MKLGSYTQESLRTKSVPIKQVSIYTLLLLFLSVTSGGQDNHPPGAGAFAAAPAAAPHFGSSPFPPNEEEDTKFVVDQSPGLDTGCTYRSGGPLIIDIPVSRYVGPVGGDGFLIDPALLISRNLLSAKAQIRLPVFDIDINGGGDTTPPEIDKIFFNGEELGDLTGDDSVWKLNSFEVPISLVKFPPLGSPGNPPPPALNRIEVQIDVASDPENENWCMSIDWIELEFSAIAPIFLVHGTNAQSDTWEPDFTAFFTASGAPWSNDINLQANGSILGNGQLLADRVTELAAGFGAKKCHIIAHSKGGLDTRAYLNNRYDPTVLEVLSVYTLSTPHHGTIVSDIIVAGRAANDPTSNDPDLEYLLDNDYSILSTPQEPAIGNQTTTAMAAFNRQFPSIPNGILFYNYGADADVNNNGTISAAETAPLLPTWLPNSTRAAAGNAMYNAIGRTATIKTTVKTNLWGLNEWTEIDIATTNTPFDRNDLTVSTTSAHAPSGTYLSTRADNHSSIKSPGLAGLILSRILSDFPNP